MSVLSVAVLVAVTVGAAGDPPPNPKAGAEARRTLTTVRSPIERAVAQSRVPGRTKKREQTTHSTAYRRADLERNRFMELPAKELAYRRAGERWDLPRHTRSDGLSSRSSARRWPVRGARTLFLRNG